MALVLVDGFDHYGNLQAVEKFWTGAIFEMVPGRGFGGQAMEVITNNPVRKVLPSTYSTIIAGAALQVGDTAPGVIFSLDGGGFIACSVGVAGTHLFLADSSGLVVATGTTPTTTNSWFYVEIKLTKGSTGTAEVHLNGAVEITSTVGNYGTANIDTIEFSQHSFGGHTYVDDVVVMDTSGSSPTNNFLGDVRIETLYPVADGHYTAWTPKFGTDHYAMVNEHQIDGDGSYVYDASPGDIDSYKMDTFIGTIYGAQLNIGARKGDAALRQLAPLIRQAGTDHVGATHTLSTDYLFYSWQLDNDPTGSPWLAATINADDFGQKLIA